MIYSEPVYPRVEDFDFHGQMTPSALLKVFENVSSHHAYQVGISVMERSLSGTAWLLTDWRVEILRTPTHKDQLLAETWLFQPHSSSRTSRELQLKDSAGAVLARASAAPTRPPATSPRNTRSFRTGCPGCGPPPNSAAKPRWPSAAATSTTTAMSTTPPIWTWPSSWSPKNF